MTTAFGHDDVATLTLGMAGLDETQSTADDYTINVVYGGIGTSGCDMIANLGGAAGVAYCSFAGASIASGHDRLLGSADSAPARLEFNKGAGDFIKESGHQNRRAAHRDIDRAILLLRPKIGVRRATSLCRTDSGDASRGQRETAHQLPSSARPGGHRISDARIYVD